MERAVIAGASGFMGRHLAAAYREAGREVVLIGRGSGSDVRWGDADGLRRALDGASVLVNLAGRTVGARIGLPAFRWMLEPAMRVLGTESELVLKSRWVAPGVLEETGFAFAHPRLDEALADIWERRGA